MKCVNHTTIPENFATVLSQKVLNFTKLLKHKLRYKDEIDFYKYPLDYLNNIDRYILLYLLRYFLLIR